MSTDSKSMDDDVYDADDRINEARFFLVETVKQMAKMGSNDPAEQLMGAIDQALLVLFPDWTKEDRSTWRVTAREALVRRPE